MDIMEADEYAVSEAVSNDNEDLCEEALLLPNNEDIMESEMQSPMTQAELLCASEDLSVLKLRKMKRQEFLLTFALHSQWERIKEEHRMWRKGLMR